MARKKSIDDILRQQERLTQLGSELMNRDRYRGESPSRIITRWRRADDAAARYIKNINEKRGTYHRALNVKVADLHKKYAQSTYMTANAG
ncbi:MAG: hypothetical protein LIP02_03975 [Bacteroidales bacterium]|nr:hypothetical protein [Bacteroidales bacterium]